MLLNTEMCFKAKRGSFFSFFPQFTRAGEARGERIDLQRLSGARRAAQGKGEYLQNSKIQTHEHELLARVKERQRAFSNC